MYGEITILDYILTPLYFLFIVWFSRRDIRKNNKDPKIYKYYIPGLVFKLMGGLAVCFIYVFYYGGGDTLNYFHSSYVLLNLAGKSMYHFLGLLIDIRSHEAYSFFDNTTNYPLYWSDDNAFSVVRFAVPFVFLGAKLLIPSTLLLSWATYYGIWKLYLVFVEQFPNQRRELAYAILFVPSVIFWGSGILKDSFSLSASCLMIYGMYRLLKNRWSVKYYFLLAFSSYLIISIKPYIFLSIISGLVIWISFEWLYNVKRRLVRIFLYPIVFFTVWLSSGYIISVFGEQVGGYYSSIDDMLNRAVVIQQDLTREYYGENSFNIGSFDASISSLLSKSGPALTAGLFRPFIWEAKNPLMLLSGVENLFLLLLTIYVVVRTGPVFFMKRIIEKPFLIIFSFVFSLVFAFIIGLITANFGALVRYKIPLIPFYLSGLLIVLGKHRAYRKGKLAKEVSPFLIQESQNTKFNKLL